MKSGRQVKETLVDREMERGYVKAGASGVEGAGTRMCKCGVSRLVYL